MKAKHLLAASILGLMLALGLVLVLSTPATIEAGRPASAGLLGRLDDAFQVIATGPEPNALAVSPTALVTATFNGDVDAATVSAATFPVWGAQTGRYAGAYSAPGGEGVQFDAAAPFKPGEVIVATASSGMESSGGDSLSPYLWQFTADVAGGSGEFLAARIYAVGDGPTSVAAGDLDGDGDLDLAVANEGDGNVSLLRNQGDGTFAAQALYAVGAGPQSVVAGDLDGDGNLDLAVANQWGDNVSVLLNRGDGTFAAQVTYGVGDYPRSVAAGDLDGDGDLDLAVANLDDDNISVLMGVSPPTAPVLISPPDGGSICDTTPAFEWSPVDAATSYRIQVDTSPDFPAPTIDATTADSDYTPASALPLGTYYWRVLAANDCGESDWSSIWVFTLLATPSRPEPSSPADGESTCDDTPTFQWSAVDGATSYRLQVDASSDFASPTIDATTANSDYTPASALPPGTYYWRVRAANDCGESDWSSIWVFTLLATPSRPEPSSPADGQSTCDDTPTFQWSAVDGAERYRIQVATSASFTTRVINKLTSKTRYTPDVDLSPGTYYWRVRAINDCGKGPWSTKWQFTIESTPAKPELASPADGGNTCEPRPAFDWSPVSGATSYRIQVADDAGFSSPVIDERTSVSAYVPNADLAPGSYYWRARAANDCGEGAWSSSWSLALLSVPAAPTLIAPEDSSPTCEATPTFTWSPVSGAISYSLQVATHTTFAAPVISATTPYTAYTPASALPPGAYYWRARAANDCGEGDWSSSWSLTLLPVPAAPTLIAPEDSSRTCEAMPTFAWSPVSGAISYTLQVATETSFASPVISATTPYTAYTPVSALPPGAYHWRARAASDCGAGDWSSVWGFERLACLYLPLILREQ